MIEKLSIQNFQSHKNTELEFDAGLNVIVGATDSGKSAILRALNWLIYNKPSGNSFKSHWGGVTSVSAIIDNTFISRIKDAQDSYIIKNPGKKQKELKAFGQNVPDVITRFLNLGDVNIQKQLDNPFLLTESPGKVSQFFNRIANLDKIDSSLSKINSEISKTKQLIKFNEESIDEKKEELLRYDNLHEIELLYKKLSRLVNKAEIIEKKIEKTLEIIDAISLIEFNIGELTADLSLEPLINELLDLYKTREKSVNALVSLNNILTSIRKVNAQIESYSEIINDDVEIYALQVLYQDKRKLNNDLVEINALLAKMDRLSKAIASEESELVTLEKKWHKIKGTECPICGNKI